jgi:hypothetical protein
LARSFDLHFLPTLGCPRTVALHFTHRDQLVTVRAPVRVRPCWAHKKTPAPERDPQARVSV